MTPQSQTPQKEWTKEEVDQLSLLYPDNSNDVVAGIIGRSVSAVAHKAHRLRIKKSETFHESANSPRYKAKKPNLFTRLLNFFRVCFGAG